MSPKPSTLVGPFFVDVEWFTGQLQMHTTEDSILYRITEE